MRAKSFSGMTCSIAGALEAIGDRWAVLLLRDLALGLSKYDELQVSTGMPTTTLSTRLKHLEGSGLVERRPSQDKPPRHEYRLTDKGLALHPVIMAMVHWGDAHLAGEAGPPVLHRHLSCGCQFDPVMVCSECREEVTPRQVQVLVGPGGVDPHHLPLGDERSA